MRFDLNVITSVTVTLGKYVAVAELCTSEWRLYYYNDTEKGIFGVKIGPLYFMLNNTDKQIAWFESTFIQEKTEEKLYVKSSS